MVVKLRIRCAEHVAQNDLQEIHIGFWLKKPCGKRSPG
jgi:hypothetical protein